LIYDEVNDRLLTCSFQNSAPIVSIDPETGQTSYALWTGLHNLDAMAQDHHGNIYVTCNGTNSVYRYDSNLENRIVVSSGHNCPSGLEYNRDGNILAVSNFFTDIVDFVSMAPFSIDDIPEEGLKLNQNFPNPFRNSTTICFSISEPAHVILTLYDTRGRFITTLLDDYYLAGSYDFLLNVGSFSDLELSPGIYFIHCKNTTLELTKEITLIR